MSGTTVERRSAGPIALPFHGSGTSVALAALLTTLVLFALTATDAWGQATLWESGHWTVAALAAALLAYLGYRRAPAEERAARGALAVGLVGYLLGQVAWDLQVTLGVVTVPAVSDVFFLSSALPMAWAFVHVVRRRLASAERVAFSIDAAMLVAVVSLLLWAAFGSTALVVADPLAGAILLLYPIAFIGAAGIGALAGLHLAVGPAWTGIVALVGGLTITGLAWVVWLQQAVLELPPVGSAVNYVFSIGLLAVGLGADRLCFAKRGGHLFERVSAGVGVLFPALASVAALLVIMAVHRAGPGPVTTWVEAWAGVVVILALMRQSLLLVERQRSARREHALAEAEREARVRAEEALGARLASEARYREVVEVFGRLAEQLSFAAEEEMLVRSGVAALRRLVASDAGDLLLANPSQDRLVAAAAWGGTALAIGEPVDVPPVSCLGIRRGSVYSVPDAGDPLTLPCPAHPISAGSSLCVPMMALGQVIGVVHLASASTGAFAVDDERQASRVAEQVALAIANARLVRTMESMALTDPLTRLHNARFFDPFLDRELDASRRRDEPLGLIMVDLDHFKAFNDEYGHPAGDEALRVFARAALTVLRDSDTLARYGGEEFVVVVRGGDADATAAVAERLRVAVERSTVEIGPGRYASFTASLGVATTVLHGLDRLALLRSADRALYRAKRSGRNRVMVAGAPRLNVRGGGAGDGRPAERRQALG